MIRFEAEKLRDYFWKKRFDQKLAEIREIQHQHTYIGYATHQDIVSELIAIYEQNLIHYKACYETPLHTFSTLDAQLRSASRSVHPQRFGELLQLRQQIALLLEAEDYTQNKQAAPLIEEMKEKLSIYEAEMKQLRAQLENHEQELEALVSEIWQETHDQLRIEFQQYKTAVLGDHIPNSPLEWDATQIESSRASRQQAFHDLLLKTKPFKRFRNKVSEFEHGPLSRAQFDKLEQRLGRLQRRRQLVWGTLIAVVASLFLGGALYGPQLWQRYQRDRDWGRLQQSPTYMGYEQFIKTYKTGPLVTLAREEQLSLEQGYIEGYIDPQGKRLIYTGELDRGLPHGQGLAVYADSARYQGQWVAGLPTGMGTYIDSVGKRYEGQWKAGRKSGSGIMRYANGDVYEGKWASGQREGAGTLVRADSSYYSGSWKNDQFHGWGTLTYPDGSKYVGNWQQGVQSGQGTYDFTDGSRYEGKWRNGKQEGRGNYIWSNGKIYRGSWHNGRREGEGTLNWPNGGVFVGVWKNDRIAGKGSFTTRFREPYDGIFKEDDSGTITLYDDQGNEIRKGVFTDGMYIKNR